MEATQGRKAMAAALDGVRVLDLSQGAAGPVCTMILGDLGAEVVKVEPPEGDWGRGLGPPFVDGVAAAFLGMNRNKRSLVVDLKKPGGCEAVLRLAGSFDVLVESFRPGVMERLGLGYEELRERNPRLIYASISAFGRVGPWRDRPGVDGLVQAMSGLMSVTGTSDGPPVKVGVPAADMTGGFLAALAVLAALLARERTGEGQRVDVSLLDGLLAFQMVPLAMFLASGQSPGRQGSAAPYAAPNEAFATRDGHVMVAAYTPARWRRLCEVLGVAELADDPRFDTNAKRVRNRQALRQTLEPLFRTRTTAEWVRMLEEADIVCGPLLDYPELVSQEHVSGSGMVITLRHPILGDLRVIGSPLRFSATPTRARRPPPLAGEHSREILEEAGFSPQEIRELIDAGAVIDRPAPAAPEEG